MKFKKGILVFGLLIISQQVTCQGGWAFIGVDSTTSLFTKIYWHANSITYSESSGGVYAGGSFTNEDGGRYVGYWDRNTSYWLDAGNLNANDDIDKVTTMGLSLRLYACGKFTNGAGQNYVASKLLNSWDELSTSNYWRDDGIADITSNGNDLYALGSFVTKKENEPDHYYSIAYWDNNSWRDLGDSMIYDILRKSNDSNFSVDPWIKIQVDPVGTLYAACPITDYQTDPLNLVSKIAVFKKEKGSFWQQLGSSFYSYPNELGYTGSVRAIAADKSNIFIAGDFINAFGNYYVAQYGNNSWNEYGTWADSLGKPFYPDGPINSIVLGSLGSDLYAAGEFTDDEGAAYVAKCDILKNWSRLGKKDSELPSTPVIFSLCFGELYEDDIYASGLFFEKSGKSYFLAHYSPANCLSVDVKASDTNIVSGTTITFSASSFNAGSNPIYRWSKNGVLINGEKSIEYKDSTLNNNDVIKCTVTGNSDCSIFPVSDSVIIHVNTSLEIFNFSGNGNWSNPSNWDNGKIPPNPLNAGQEIKIQGDCTLDITQTITAGGILTISPNAKFKILGNVKITKQN